MSNESALSASLDASNIKAKLPKCYSEYVNCHWKVNKMYAIGKLFKVKVIKH